MRLPIYHGLRFVSSPFPRYYSDSLAADSTSLVKQKYLGISTGSAFVILALCLRKQRTGCKQKKTASSKASCLNKLCGVCLGADSFN
jgi:hypothetical protein